MTDAPPQTQVDEVRLRRQSELEAGYKACAAEHDVIYADFRYILSKSGR